MILPNLYKVNMQTNVGKLFGYQKPFICSPFVIQVKLISLFEQSLVAWR